MRRNRQFLKPTEAQDKQRVDVNAPAMEYNHNEIPREPVIPEKTQSSGKAAVSKTPTVNVEPSVPVAQKTRTSSVNLVPSRLADFDIKRFMILVIFFHLVRTVFLVKVV